jgi:hypothetical protein
MLVLEECLRTQSPGEINKAYLKSVYCVAYFRFSSSKQSLSQSRECPSTTDVGTTYCSEAFLAYSSIVKKAPVYRGSDGLEDELFPFNFRLIKVPNY